MDYILFAVLALFFVKGFVKGFVSTLLSLISVFVVGIVSWKLVEYCLPFVYDFLQEPISNFLSSILNNSITGTFENITEFENTIMSSNLAMFAVIKILLPNLTFEGSLTAGQILSPSLTLFVCKLLTFLILFFTMNLTLKLIRSLINKLIKVCGLSFGNRILGAVLGIVKGLIVFSFIYFVLLTISNVILNAALNDFISGGQISSVLYNWIIKYLI